MKIIFVILVVLALAVAGAFFWMGKTSRDSAPTLGISAGQFTPCPDSPNCVSTDASDEAHRFALLSLKQGASWDQVVEVVKQTEGLTVTDTTGDYLRAEVRSPVVGFIDDLEVHLRDGNLAMRSASRVGYSDMGANRKRLDDIESRLRAAAVAN